MNVTQLLRDATDSVEGASRYAQEATLFQLLEARYGAGCITQKGIAKWFERGRIPGTWLVKIAALPTPPLDLTKYL